MRGILLLLALLLVRSALAEEPPWRVLLLADDFSMPASIVQVQAMEEELTAHAGRPLEVYRESLDVVRFSGAEEAQATILREKYRDVPLDLIVTLAPLSLAFAERHLTTLQGRDIPIVFLSVMADTEPNTRHRGAIAGITIPFDVSGTVDLAMKMSPGRKHLAVVAGTSRYDRAWLARARAALDARDDDLVVTYLTDRPVDELTAVGSPGTELEFAL